MPSVEAMIERIMDALTYEELLEILFSRDDTADAVSEILGDLVDDVDTPNEED